MVKTELYSLNSSIQGTVTHTDVCCDCLIFSKKWSASPYISKNTEKSLDIQNGILLGWNFEACMCFTTWSSGTWGMLHAISKECAMAPSHITDWPLLLLSFFFSQSVLQAHKSIQNWKSWWVKYRKKRNLGERIQWDPVGWQENKVQVILFVFFFSNHFSNHTAQLVCEFSYGNILLGFSLMPWLVSLAAESDNEAESREEMKEEQELGVVKLWMEVGVFWCLLKKHRNYCGRYIHFLPVMVQSFNPFCHCSLLSLIFVMDPIF